MVVFDGGTFLGGSGSLRDFSGSQWVVVDRSRWFVGDRGWLKIFFWVVCRQEWFVFDDLLVVVVDIGLLWRFSSC